MRLCFHAFLLASCAAAIDAPAQDVPARDALKPAVATLEAFIHREMKAKGLPAVSIALVEGDRITWSRGFGMARPGVPATADTVHRVASVSKLFTDLAVMQLVEKGELDLDAPVSKYLPDFSPKNPFDKPITLRQMMAHRSGLARESPVGNYFDPTSPSLADTVRSLNDTELVFAPGSRTKYSNAAIATVGLVVEKLRGEPFDATVKRTVLDPLGMTTASFELSPEMKAKAAEGEMWTYDGRTFPAPTFPLGIGPAGNMYASVTDLGHFLIAIFGDGKVVKPETLQQMFTPQFADPGAQQGFGLGFRVGRFDGHRRVGHTGAIYGFATERLGAARRAARRGRGRHEGLRQHVGKSDRRPRAAGLDGREERPAPHHRRDDLAAAGRPCEALAGPIRDGRRGRRPRLAGRPPLPHAAGRRLEVRAAIPGRHADRRRPPGLSVAQIFPVGEGKITLNGKPLDRQPSRKPEPPPARWLGLIGEYGWDHDTLYILEWDGRLYALIEWFFFDRLEEVSPDVFRFPDRGLYVGEYLRFSRDAGRKSDEGGRRERDLRASQDRRRRRLDLPHQARAARGRIATRGDEGVASRRTGRFPASRCWSS